MLAIEEYEEQSQELSGAMSRALGRLTTAERDHFAIELSDALRQNAGPDEIAEIVMKWQVSSMVMSSVEFQQQSNAYLGMRLEGKISDNVTQEDHARLIRELRSLV